MEQYECVCSSKFTYMETEEVLIRNNEGKK